MPHMYLESSKFFFFCIILKVNKYPYVKPLNNLIRVTSIYFYLEFVGFLFIYILFIYYFLPHQVNFL